MTVNKTSITSFTGEYAFLSNFWIDDVYTRSLVFPSVEHAYQAGKCASSEDVSFFLQPTVTPGVAKRRGKKVALRPDWERIKDSVMLELVRSKFTHNKTLSRLLLATGDAELVEGNWWGDRYWGVYKGEGQNKLGKILMMVRKELRDANS